MVSLKPNLYASRIHHDMNQTYFLCTGKYKLVTFLVVFLVHVMIWNLQDLDRLVSRNWSRCPSGNAYQEILSFPVPANIGYWSWTLVWIRLGAISNCQLPITLEVIANDPITNYFTKKVMGNAPNYPLLFGYISNWISSW